MKNNSLQQKTAKIIENQHLDFERFFITHYKMLFSVGYQLSADKELTKDLLQSFFLELWESRFQSQHIQYLEAYLKKAFHRKMIKALQKRSKTNYRINENQVDLVVPSYETLLVNFQENHNRKIQLEQAIDNLPPQQKEALSLRFKNGLDYKEIAQTTGKSQQTIYNQIHQAILKLRKNFSFFS